MDRIETRYFFWDGMNILYEFNSNLMSVRFSEFESDALLGNGTPNGNTV